MFVISLFVAFSTFFVGICSILYILINIILKKDTKGTVKTFKICLILFIISFGLMIASVKNEKNENSDYMANSENKEVKENEVLKIEVSSENSTERIDDTTDTEILFRDIPWGISFLDVNEKLDTWGLWNLSGESYKECSVDEILLGDYKGIDFEYSGINVISNTLKNNQDVAGYTTKEITLYFAYLPVDGYLTYDEKDTALYGAQYKFEPVNLQDMYNDLKDKLSNLYGEPSKTTQDTDMWENQYTYTYWYGANDTELVLRYTDSEKDTTGFYEDEIYITYAWRNGDTLLQNASDAVKKEKSDKEKDVQGNENTDGL